MSELPEATGVGMKDPLTLLRRERDRPRPGRRRTVLACAALALAAAPSAVASSLQPDPATASAPAALRPDAFGAAAAAGTTAPERMPADASVPVHGAGALPTLAKPVTSSGVQKPAATKVVPPATPRPLHVTQLPARPIATTPPALPAPRAVGTAREKAPRTTAPAIPARVTHRITLRLHVPLSLHGSARVPAILRVAVAPVAIAAHRRDLLPAALALLALVATSGCLLAVAAGLRRDGAGV